MEDVISLISSVDPTLPIEASLADLLESAIRLCPGFCCGSVVLEVKPGEWRYTVWKGFSDELGKVIFDPTKDVLPKSEEPIVIDDIFWKAKDSISEDAERIYRAIGSTRIKKTISVGLFDPTGRLIGGIFIDSFNDVEVTPEMLSAVRLFGRIASLYLSMKLQYERERLYEESVIKAMLKMIELREAFAKGHSENVARYAEMISKAMKLSVDDVERIRWASLIHDLGKLSIPESVLNKRGKLTREEFELVKQHPVESERVIADFEWLRKLSPVVRHHHERWDGTGYPDGLKGEEIPFESRIISVADAFEAMTHPRPYRRKVLSIEEAIREIEKGAGAQFDPYVARVAIEVFRSLPHL